MTGFPATWVLAIDCGCSRIFSWTAADGELTELKEEADRNIMAHASDQGSDCAQTSDDFAQQVADQLKNALNAGLYERLVLISRTEFLSVFRSKLDPEVCHRVAELIGVDMTGATAEEIRERLPVLHA